MIEKLKQNKSLLIIFIIAMVLIITGITFSLYNVLFKGNKNQTLTIGDINFTYDEKTNGLSLDNNDILSDEDGLKQTKYFDFDISLTSTNNTSITYQIAIEENTTSTLSNDKVKVYLTDQEDNKILDPTSINNLSIDDKGYRKLYINTINTNETQKYRLRAWVDTSKAFEVIDNNGSHSLTMTSATYKFKINVYDTETIDKSGANKPVLASNMLPVYYDETNETWKKADVSNTDKTNPWYSYNSSGEYKGMWANAVTVTETNRTTYLNAEPGTTIPMDDITTMWVWIPRFKVNTTDFDAIRGECRCSDTSLSTKTECEKDYSDWICPNPGVIDVTFVKENEIAIDAFTFGDKELSGFWYGKFEVGHTTLSSSTTDNNLGCSNETCSNANGIIIKPNVVNLRYNNVSNFFFASRSMEQSGNSFGFVSTEVDTHMSKNSEWGAVAYLTQSIYGRCINSTTCSEVYINNSSRYYTGRSGDTPSADFTSTGTYEYNQNIIVPTIVEGTGTNITPTITNDTTYPWTKNNGVYSSGNSAQDDTTSTLTYTFTLTEKGAVSFDYSVSSEEGDYDIMKYEINNGSTTVVTGATISGTYRGTKETSLQYESKTHVLESGTYTLVFTYSKDSEEADGLDKGYVKNVKILNGAQTMDKVLPGGQNASTTGTIYGIYDMNGGTYEYVMGVLADTNGKPRSGDNSVSNSGFTGMLNDGTTYTGLAFPDNKYYNLYTGTSYIGHALSETSGWYKDGYTFIESSNPWFIRSDNASEVARAGVFYFSKEMGHSTYTYSSRFAITNE